MIGIVTFVTYILGLVSLILYYKKINIIKATILSMFIFFVEFVIISGLFFWIDYFKFRFVLITILILNTILFLFLFKKNRKVEIDFDLKKYIIPFLIGAIILPVTINKFELHGMGQDEGVYQIKAIALMTGNTEKQLDFEEYQNLKTDEGKERYEYMVKSRFVGFDNYDIQKPTLSQDKEMSVVSGIFHGIPTFPALLALWGKIFGMANMQGIQTIFFIISIFFIWFTAENLHLKRSEKILSTLIFAISPVVLWVSKSSLSEMFLTTIVCAMIYFWTDTEDKNSIYLSSICVIAFAFFHVTIYTIMPVIVSIYIIKYLFDKEKSNIYAGILSIIGFMIGYTMMIYVSPTYTTNNTRRPIEEFIPYITDNMLLPIIYIASVIAIAFLVLIYFYSIKKVSIYEKIKKIHKYLSYLVMILFVLMGIKIILSGISNFKEYESIITSIKNSNIMGYVWGSGIVLIPISIVLVFKRIDDVLYEKNKCIMLVLFMYCIIIYSAILRTTIPHYYYYSRYLVPFIPIITLFAAQLMNKFNYKLKYIICMLAACIYLPCNCTLAVGLDDTRMNWDILEDIVENIDGNDAVIIEDSSNEVRNIVETLALPIKYITGAEIYPVLDDVEDQIENIEKSGKQVVYITDKEDSNNKIYELEYKNRVHVSDDYQAFHNELIPYPRNFSKNMYDIYLYKTKFKNIYNFKNDVDIKYSGFGPIEEDFMWSYSKETNIWCNLLKKDYVLKIKLGPGLPIDNYLKLSVNGNYIESYEVKKGQNNIELKYNIPKNTLNNGDNVVTLQSELWKPSDFGSDDNRELGFSLMELKFEE